MSEQSTLQAVADVVRDVLDDPDLNIGMETTADQTPNWDSVNHITIVVAVEQKFGVKFRTAEVEELRNVGDFVRLIQKKLASKG